MAMQASSEQSPVVALYERLISSWNRRSASEFAACFAPEGNAIGFDGTQMNGARQIEKALQEIFGQHPTAHYVTIVREVRPVGSDVVLLRAVAGMVPPGADTIKPEINAIQSLVADRIGSESRAGWKIALFQNTPAAYHGRPDAAEALTQELQQTYDAREK